MAAEQKPESRLIEATERTTAALQGLQARLTREASAPVREEPREEPPREEPPREETVEELGRQLEEYFSASVGPSAGALEQIREKVIQGVVDRIFQAWEDPRGASIKSQVVQRLIDRVLEDLGQP